MPCSLSTTRALITALITAFAMAVVSLPAPAQATTSPAISTGESGTFANADLTPELVAGLDTQLLAPELTVGGVTANPDSRVHKAIVFLFTLTPSGSIATCTGTLINRTTVLTARHCVRDDVTTVGVDNMFVVFDQSTRPIQQFIADASTFAPETVATTWGTYLTQRVRSGASWIAPSFDDVPFGDLALLTLDTPAPSSVTPAKVWGGNIADGDIFAASGFGPSNPRALALDNLGEAYYYIYHATDYTVSGRTYDIGYLGLPLGNTRITQGDSGGPLHNYDYIIGVNSAGQSSPTGHALFAPTILFADWIEAHAPGSTAGRSHHIATPAAARSQSQSQQQNEDQSSGGDSALAVLVLIILGIMAAVMGYLA